MIGADAVHGGDRRRRARHQDRRRRRRHRRDEPVLRPAGYEYPPGFPKGGRKCTTPKVIVARAFPGPGSGRAGRLAVDPKESFHGTHVSGIVAGNAGTTAPAGPRPPADDRPLRRRAARVDRQLPRLQRADADRQRRQHARDRGGVRGRRRRRHGRHQLLGRRRRRPTRQRRDVSRRSTTSSNAGVVPVISAGNDRDDFGLGTAGSPGTAPDAISVAAVSNTHVFAPALTVTAPDAPASLARVAVPAGRRRAPAAVGDGGPDARRRRHAHRHRRASRSTARSAAPADRPERARRRCAARRSRARSRSSRAAPAASSPRRARAPPPARSASSSSTTAPARPNPIPIQLQLPAGMIGRPRRRRLRGYLADDRRPHDRSASAARSRTSPPAASGMITSFSSAGPTAFGHALKPDVAAPGGADPVVDPAERRRRRSPSSTGRAWRRRTCRARPRCSCSGTPTGRRTQIKSALMSTAGPAWGDTARTQEASVLLEGAGLVNVQAADDPRIFTDPALALATATSTPRIGARRAARCSSPSRTPAAAPGRGASSCGRSRRATGASLDAAAGRRPSRRAGRRRSPSPRDAAGGAPPATTTASSLLRQGASRAGSRTRSSSPRPRSRCDGPPTPLAQLQVGTTRRGAARVDVYRWPGSPFGPPPDYTGQPVDEGGAEHALLDARRASRS